MVSTTSTSSTTLSRIQRASWKTGLAVFICISSALLSVNANLAVAAPDDETNGEISGADGEKPKTPYSLQASDPDRPRDPAVEAAKKKAALDAAATKKESADEGPPVYQKWQFWALGGAVVVGLVGIIIGGIYLSHSLHGGDVASCPKDFAGCFGQGR
jgi:hypothetical protein